MKRRFLVGDGIVMTFDEIGIRRKRIGIDGVIVFCQPFQCPFQQFYARLLNIGFRHGDVCNDKLITCFYQRIFIREIFPDGGIFYSFTSQIPCIVTLLCPCVNGEIPPSAISSVEMYLWICPR